MRGKEGFNSQPFEEKFAAGSPGGVQPEAEDERGDLYQEIGISSEQFKEAVQQLRGELQNKRSSAAEEGEGFNEAEYLRKELVGSPLVHAESDEGVLFRQTIRAWDALAFDRYSDEVKKRAVLNLSFLNAGQQPHDFNPSKYDCMRTMAKLDVMTTAIGLSHRELDPKWIVTKTQLPSDIDAWEQQFWKENRIGMQFGPIIGEFDYGFGGFR